MSDEDRKEVDKSWVYCYGATVVISDRLRNIRKKRTWLKFASYLIPVVGFGSIGVVGLESEFTRYIFQFAGIVALIIGILAAYDLFFLEKDEEKLRELHEANFVLLTRAQRISRLKQTDFKAEYRGFTDECEKLANKEQLEFSWTQEEDRKGMRAAFFKLQEPCTECGIKPLSQQPPAEYKEGVHCHNCGSKKENQ